jgi:hypothetical protein
MLTQEQAVLAANTAFYEAFASGDLSAMRDAWSRKQLLACIHPGWQALHGHDQVMASWRAILESPPPVSFEDARAFVIDQVAFVTCVERVGQNRLAATNVFALEDGLWRMVHHQAGPFTPQALPTDMRPPKDKLN